MQLFLFLGVIGLGIWYRAELTRFVTAHRIEAIGLFHLVVSGGFLIGGLKVGIQRWQFIQTAERATAEVVSIDEHRAVDEDNPAGHPRYTPVVLFRTKDGRDIRKLLGFRSTYMSKTPLPLKSKVTVLFNPARPEAAIQDDWSKWQPIVLYLFFGVVFGIVGLIILIAGDRT